MARESRASEAGRSEPCWRVPSRPSAQLAQCRVLGVAADDEHRAVGQNDGSPAGARLRHRGKRQPGVIRRVIQGSRLDGDVGVAPAAVGSARGLLATRDEEAPIRKGGRHGVVAHVPRDDLVDPLGPSGPRIPRVEAPVDLGPSAGAGSEAQRAHQVAPRVPWVGEPPRGAADEECATVGQRQERAVADEDLVSPTAILWPACPPAHGSRCPSGRWVMPPCYTRAERHGPGPRTSPAQTAVV